LRQHDAVRRVEAADDLSTSVSQRVGQLAVDPDLGVVVDHRLEDDRRASRVEVADLIRDGDFDPIPVEADTAVRQAQQRLLWGERAPAPVPDDVVRSVRDRSWSQWIVRSADGDEIDLLDTAVGVAPGASDKTDSLVGLEIHDRIGAPWKQL